MYTNQGQNRDMSLATEPGAIEKNKYIAKLNPSKGYQEVQPKSINIFYFPQTHQGILHPYDLASKGQ